MTQITIPDLTLILSVLSILGIVFSVYLYFRNPQITLERRQAVDEVSQRAKAAGFSQEMQWQKEANERRFAEMQITIKDSMTLAQNHIHTVETKVEGLQKTVEQMGKDIIRLSTTIEERIPKR